MKWLVLIRVVLVVLAVAIVAITAVLGFALMHKAFSELHGGFNHRNY